MEDRYKGGKGDNTIFSVISHKLNGRNIIARHLDVRDKMTIGYVMRKGVAPSRYAKAYIAALMRHCR